MLENIALFNGLMQKMDYLQTRQRVLSQNVTNVNTPGYQAQDVKAPDFAKTLGMHSKIPTMQKLAMATTSPDHLNIGGTSAKAMSGSPVKATYDIAPDGNSVSLEEQMMQSSRNAMDYQLVTNLYNKNFEILRKAIGR